MSGSYPGLGVSDAGIHLEPSGQTETATSSGTALGGNEYVGNPSVSGSESATSQFSVGYSNGSQTTETLSSQGSATADLASGTFQASGSAQSFTKNTDPGTQQTSQGSVHSWTESAISDVLSIAGAITGTETVEISQTATANIQADNMPFGALVSVLEAHATSNSVETAAPVTAEVFIGTPGDPTKDLTYQLEGGEPRAGLIVDSISPTSITYTSYVDVDISDASRTVQFESLADVTPNSGSDGTVEASIQTQPIVISLPTGLTYTSASGVLLTDSPAACYCPGTMIQTVEGERPVEALSIGDLVTSHDSEPRPIRWIGQRSYDGRFIAGNHLMLPVTIRAGAIADGVPHTDLVVSPGHAMWVDDQLVPTWRLVNGITITQAKAVEEITYFHVELDHHDLLLANGAPAESFLDETGFRGQFHNAAEFADLYPNATPLVPMQARLEDGFALQRIQERLAGRAGILPVIEPVGELRGFLDQAGREQVCGWAQDMDSPEKPVALEIQVGGMPVLSVLANAYRADLRQAGLGSGCHAFDVALSPGLSGAVTVQRVTDGALLRVADALARPEQRQAA